MRLTITLFLFLLSFGAMASSGCQVNDYLKSLEGKEKLANLVERSKGLIISKLEEIGIEENQIHINAVFPQSIEDSNSSLSVSIKSKNLRAEHSRIVLSKVIRDEDCGLEISIQNGQLLNVESGKNFGSLGKVKEFIKMI